MAGTEKLSLVTIQHLVYRPEIGTVDTGVTHPGCRIAKYFHCFYQALIFPAFFNVDLDEIDIARLTLFTQFLAKTTPVRPYMTIFGEPSR